MKELSLNILDIAENSVKAGATLTEITVEENPEQLLITIKDDGCGMTDEVLKTVENPFYTTRTTRKVGMGIPLFKLEAEQTGGGLTIRSKSREQFPDDHGTTVAAQFIKSSIDCIPLGDVVSSIVTLIQGHPDTDFLFRHIQGGKTIELDTRSLREVLEGVPLNSYEVIRWIEEFLREQYNQTNTL